jgi:hypothetical protein
MPNHDSRLEKQPTDLRQYTCYFGDRMLGRASVPSSCVKGVRAGGACSHRIGNPDRSGNQFQREKQIGDRLLVGYNLGIDGTKPPRLPSDNGFEDLRIHTDLLG